VSGDEPASAGASRDEEGVVRGTALAFVVQMVTGLFTAVLVLVLVRLLGASGYGIFALALSTGAIASLIADLGVTLSTARFVAERRDDPVAVTAVLSAGLRLKLAFATVLAVVLIAVAGPIAAAYDEPGLAWPLRVMAVSMWAEGLLNLYTASFVALRRVGLNVRVILVESAVEATATLGLVIAGTGVVGAVAGRAVGYGVGAVFAGAVAVRTLGPAVLKFRRARRADVHDVAVYGRPLFWTNSAYTVYADVDLQLVAALLSARSVGLLSAPLRLITFLGYLGQAVANAVAPRMVRTSVHAPDTRAFAGGLRLLLVVQCLLIAPVLVWAEPLVVLLLGAPFRDAAPVLQALTPYMVLHGISPLITTTVNYLGLAARRVRLVLICLAVNVVIDLILLPRIGVVGAAIGTGVAYSIYVPAHFWLCMRSFDLPLRRLALTVARSVTASGGMAAVLALFGTRDLSPAAFVLGGIAGLAAFGALLLLSREVRVADLRALRGFVRSRLARSDDAQAMRVDP